MAAAKHEVEIIKLRFGVCSFCKRLDDRAFRVVDQNENVRQLERRVLADAQPGRNALHDRAFRSADERFGAAAVIVLLKVERHDEAAAGLAIHGAAYEHEALALAFKRAFRHVAVHGSVDRGDALRFAGLFQVHFRQHQAQGGGSVSHDAFRLFPVFGLGSELVAGDDGPLFHGYAFTREKNVRHLNADGVFEHAVILRK